MAHSVVTLIIIIAFAGIGAGYLRLATARARERAGLPSRVRAKLPLYIWALLIFLLGINMAYLFSDSHRANSALNWRGQP
jgi:hypothetical protein